MKTLPGADCGTDHELLVAKLKLKLRAIKQPKRTEKYDLQRIPDQYTVQVCNRFSILQDEVDDLDSDELWENIKTVVQENAEQYIPKKPPKRKSAWLSKDAINITVKRKKAKTKANQEEVNNLNADFQRQARKDKEVYLNGLCQKLEASKQNSKELYRTLKEITAQFTPRLGVLKNEDGNIITEEQEIKLRWQEYTEQLYQKDETITEEFQEVPILLEPEPLEEEVTAALKEIANNKSPGIDNIPIELIKQTGQQGISLLAQLCRKIWRTLKWPVDWKRSVYVPLPKKGDTRECANNRTIALISHTSKILLKIIQKRLEVHLRSEIAQEQAGFRRGRGTRDHIANIRWLLEKSREMNVPVYVCFIDYSKAFDCVDHNKLWNNMRSLGIPEHLIILIKNLYTGQEATVRTEFGNTEWFNIGKGVRQGCILSPYLFNIYSETIMRNAGLEDMPGISIGGRPLNNLRYADDTTLIANSKEDLEALIQQVKITSEAAGLMLNVKKTKIMTTEEVNEFKIGTESLDIVKEFCFLGTFINQGADCEKEIRRRIAMGKANMGKLEKVMKDRDVSRDLKIKLVQTLVFPVVTYGSESWTLKKADQNRIESFELWVWRRLLRIPWTEKKTNTWVLNQINTKMSLLNIIDKGRLTYFGHIMRADDSLEKTIMQGKLEGKRGRGRPKTRWWDNVLARVGRPPIEIIRKTTDRSAWRQLVNMVTRGRTT